MNPERDVVGQAPRMPEFNAYSADPSLRFWINHYLKQRGLSHESITASTELLSSIGARVGSWKLQDAADTANSSDPVLRTHDRTGQRIDDVAFDDSWHTLMNEVTASGVCTLPWRDTDAGYIVRAAAFEQWARLDMGVMCPVTMTSAIIPVLLKSDVPDAAAWVSRIVAASTDPSLDHPMAGMAMTEPQGGSDLGNSSTVATSMEDGTWSLTGHKWFVSHPVADVLLALARDPEAPEVEGSRGLSCFLVAGHREDGTRNGIELLRLKDKLGTRSLASAEVMFRDAQALRIGAPGAGVRTIIDMVVHTRMDCTIGSAGIMQRAITEAIHYTSHRHAFGRALALQPAMRLVLADLILEREGALALAMEVAATFQDKDPLQRLVPAFAKFWITRRAVQVCIECVEIAGGNGYVEEYPFARLYRDSQVNSTWEGSGNVIALDVLRAIHRDASLIPALRSRISDLLDAAPTEAVGVISNMLESIPDAPGEEDARRVTTHLALATQAALLWYRAGKTGDPRDQAIAHAFTSTRIIPSPDRAFGDGGEALLGAADLLLTPEQMVTQS